MSQAEALKAADKVLVDYLIHGVADVEWEEATDRYMKCLTSKLSLALSTHNGGSNVKELLTKWQLSDYVNDRLCTAFEDIWTDYWKLPFAILWEEKLRGAMVNLCHAMVPVLELHAKLDHSTLELVVKSNKRLDTVVRHRMASLTYKHDIKCGKRLNNRIAKISKRYSRILNRVSHLPSSTDLSRTNRLLIKLERAMDDGLRRLKACNDYKKTQSTSAYSLQNDLRKSGPCIQTVCGELRTQAQEALENARDVIENYGEAVDKALQAYESFACMLENITLP